ncbi:MAG: NHLP bacteriocin system secretion protein [Firmicutes bacterium]|nr:NHLP bacteriocin system secretion protein [Bacillota bacterium]
MKQGLFRKVSLERLSSPEQLDQMVTVTTPKAWLAFLAIGALLVTALTWGFFGSIPTKVYGQGILLKSGGIYNLAHVSGGQITDIRVKAGDYVQKGDIVARVEQHQLVEQINDFKNQLQQLKATQEITTGGGGEGIQSELIQLNQFYSRIESSQTNSTLAEEYNNIKYELISAKIKLLQDKINAASQQDYLNKHVNSGEDLSKAKNNYELLELEVKASEATVDRLLSTITAKIATLEEKINDLQHELEYKSNIVSDEEGQVLEVKINEGDIIQPGSSIISLEETGDEVKGLELVMYIPAEEGKKILPGMEAQVSPTIVKKEEYGYLLGRVVSVSDYPATFQGMMRILGNEELVNKLAGQSTALEVRIDLVVDEDTVSGYKWSTPQGPPIKITSGTLCSGSVTINEQKPISLVFPIFS